VQSIPREVRFYETESGRVPCREWLDSLDGTVAYGVVMSRLDRVEEGNLGVHRSVGDGVTELVIDFGPGYRIYFGQDRMELIILLAGGAKKTQQADIERAKRYWRNYNA
jgi:putative addiction module killer protein